MTPREFNKELQKYGFVADSENEKRFVRLVCGVKQYVARESVRGSAWRIYLAVGHIPSCWPIADFKSTALAPWSEAESPWFYYYTESDPDESLNAVCDTKEVALRKCFDWLDQTGIIWLEAPDFRPDDRWRIDYSILVRRH